MAAALPALSLTRLTVSPSDWHYLRVKITAERPLSTHIDVLSFRLFVTQALSSTFGAVGSALFVDVLDWDEVAMEGILKVASGDLPTLWSSLTLYSTIVDSTPCMLEVLGVSGYAMGLASDSRRTSVVQ